MILKNCCKTEEFSVVGSYVLFSLKRDWGDFYLPVEIEKPKKRFGK
jgi:hypothetical protein